MSFDDDKLMKINYDPRLISFAKEVRELASMGFTIAPQISKNAKLAEGFMQQAKELEEVLKFDSFVSLKLSDCQPFWKIATFHNSIGDRMLPCLKPLMLEAAIGLSALVHDQNVATWAQVENVNNYIRRLQQAVQRLTALNQQLTMCHEQIEEKVLVSGSLLSLQSPTSFLSLGFEAI